MDYASKSQVTLLPAQLRRLAEVPGGGAIRISQFGGSTIHFDNAFENGYMDSQGNPIINPEQERLC